MRRIDMRTKIKKKNPAVDTKVVDQTACRSCGLKKWSYIVETHVGIDLDNVEFRTENRLNRHFRCSICGLKATRQNAVALFATTGFS